MSEDLNKNANGDNYQKDASSEDKTVVVPDEEVPQPSADAENTEDGFVADETEGEDSDAVSAEDEDAFDSNPVASEGDLNDLTAIDGEIPAMQTKKKKKAPIIIAIVCVVVLLLGGGVFYVFHMGYPAEWFPGVFNKYNRLGYINTTGRTIGEVADKSGMSLKDFLNEYKLPADMPKSTYESVAYYKIPVSKISEMYGMTFDQMKEQLKWDDSITENTSWGDAEGETTLENYVGEENLDKFKEQYGLGDNVTKDTKWKEIRNTVDQKNKEKAEEAKKNATPTPAAGSGQGSAQGQSGSASSESGSGAQGSSSDSQAQSAQ